MSGCCPHPNCAPNRNEYCEPKTRYRDVRRATKSKQPKCPPKADWIDTQSTSEYQTGTGMQKLPPAVTRGPHGHRMGSEKPGTKESPLYGELQNRGFRGQENGDLREGTREC